jgi:2'-5' RNA ligase
VPRLFVAIDLPEEVRESLVRLRVDIPAARWVPQEQLHLTLAFLGDLPADMLEGLKAELAAIHAHGFRLRFSLPGCFPNPARPRVLWIGTEPEARLLRLAAQVRRALLACGIPLEERPFSPHITLARLRLPSRAEAAAFLLQAPHPAIPAVEVREFTLFESRLTPTGAIHTQLQSFPLTAVNRTFEEKPHV